MKYEYRLLVRILLCFIPLAIFYIIFTPLTLYGIYLLLLFYKPVLYGITIFIQDHAFIFVEACIAGSAYYLLWLLNFLTKDIKILTRIKLFLYGSLAIYLMNLLRISILIFVSLNYSEDFFNLIHMFFWRFFISIYVALVWIFLVYKFKIKNIPIYSDIKYLYEKSLFKKSNKTKAN